MSKENEKSNYQIAKEEADKVDELIISTLQQGRSFRVEAGAGSGKTYSLNRVIEWVQANKWNEYKRKNQNVICITYTNAAVDVIAERLTSNSFILPRPSPLLFIALIASTLFIVYSLYRSSKKVS